MGRPSILVRRRICVPRSTRAARNHRHHHPGKALAAADLSTATAESRRRCRQCCSCHRLAILQVSRGIGMRALQEWLVMHSDECFFGNDPEPGDCNVDDDNDDGCCCSSSSSCCSLDADMDDQRPVLASTHYSAYACSLVLVAQSSRDLLIIDSMTLHVHGLLKGKLAEPGANVQHTSILASSGGHHYPQQRQQRSTCHQPSTGSCPGGTACSTTHFTVQSVTPSNTTGWISYVHMVGTTNTTDHDHHYKDKTNDISTVRRNNNNNISHEATHCPTQLKDDRSSSFTAGAYTTTNQPVVVLAPRQFRRHAKELGHAVLGSAKDATPFRGESLCLSTVQLEVRLCMPLVTSSSSCSRLPPLVSSNQCDSHAFNESAQHDQSCKMNTTSSSTEYVFRHISVSAPPAPCLQTIVQREQAFFDKRHSMLENTELSGEIDASSSTKMRVVDRSASKLAHVNNHSRLPIPFLPPLPREYINNKVLFGGLELYVNSSVMIPRTGSEAVLRQAKRLFLLEWTKRTQLADDNDVNCRTSSCHNIRILDLGTGSGCLVLSLVQELKERLCLGSNTSSSFSSINSLCGIGIDISLEAIDVARRNSITLGLQNNVHFFQGTFLDPLQKVPAAVWRTPFQAGSLHNYTVVVCNPPYHTRGGRMQLDASSVIYEPGSALFVEDKTDYLIYYRQALSGIANMAAVANTAAVDDVTIQSSIWLIVFEVCRDNAQHVSRLLREAGFNNVQIGRDDRGCMRTTWGTKSR